MHLENVKFIGRSAEFLVERLAKCEELTLINCGSDNAVHASSFDIMTSLKSLHIDGSSKFISGAKNSHYLHNQLETLKVKYPKLINFDESMLQFTNLKHLALFNVDF